jgi:ubiquitin-protein ligase
VEPSSERRENTPICYQHVGRYKQQIHFYGKCTLNLTDLFSCMFSFLTEPNDESGANVDAAKMWREDRQEFNRIAERIVRKTLGLPPP